MALKFELEQWQQACVAFDKGDYDVSIKSFINIADTAKMHFNIGLIFAAVDDHERTMRAYNKAITMDPYFAVAYFQRGVSHFLQNNMNAARDDFDQAYHKLRGNPIINYQQLGLNFKLYACEILFNKGICNLYLGIIDDGLTDLYHAQKAKMTEEHDVIDQAVRDRGKGYSVFSIPPLVIFRPPENRLKQLQHTDISAAMDQLANNQQQKNNSNRHNYSYHHISSEHPNYKSISSIKRKNSILVNNKLQIKRPPPLTPLPPTPTPSPIITTQLYSNNRSYNGGNSPRLFSPSSLPPTPTNSTPLMRKRNDSNFSMYQSDDSASTLSYASSNYRYPRRVDSGFESTLEDSYSSSSSVNTNRGSEKGYCSQTPVPPLPKIDSIHDDFDRELEEVYGLMSLQDSRKDKKIKVKVHYTDTRILLVSTDIMFDELKSKIIEKFEAPLSVRLQYKDEDNEMVLMVDDDDLYMARQVYKDTSEFEKMEIWCV